MDCRDAARFVQLRLDDEIEPTDCLDLERHLESCPHCRTQVEAERWFGTRVRVKLAEVSTPCGGIPPHLSDSLRAALVRADDERRFPYGRAAAACLAVSMVGALSWSSFSADAELVEETVSKHSRNLPPEVRADAVEQEGVKRFLQDNLRYPVAVPRFGRQDVPTRLVGARLSSIHDREAAYMIYDHRGARVSVFAYPKLHERFEPEGFERRDVGDRVVYVGQRRGYNVVSWQDRDLGYSMVSDVDPREMVELVSTTAH